MVRKQSDATNHRHVHSYGKPARLSSRRRGGGGDNAGGNPSPCRREVRGSEGKSESREKCMPLLLLSLVKICPMLGRGVDKSVESALFHLTRGICGHLVESSPLLLTNGNCGQLDVHIRCHCSSSFCSSLIVIVVPLPSVLALVGNARA